MPRYGNIPGPCFAFITRSTPIAIAAVRFATPSHLARLTTIVHELSSAHSGRSVTSSFDQKSC
jgi:hypothetical protein